MKAKYYKCEICGDMVYKEYWQGKIMVREYNQRMNETKPHACSLSHGSGKVTK